MQVTHRDFNSYDYILVMDQQNVDDLRRAGFGPVRKLLEFAPHFNIADVPDPYYTHNFNFVYTLITAACRSLLQFIREQEGL